MPKTMVQPALLSQSKRSATATHVGSCGDATVPVQASDICSYNAVVGIKRSMA